MHSGTLAGLFKVLAIMILLAPPITGFAIITALFDSIVIQWIAPLGIVAYCAVISLLIMLLGRKIFSNAELA